MSVAAGFGVTADQITELVERQWSTWARQVPDLALRPDSTPLERWVRSARADQVDRVLRGLTQLASADDGGSSEAALVLAWLMLPAATILAHRLRFLNPNIDEHVAALLWIEVRTFPWRTNSRVAANIRYNLRKRLLRDLADVTELPLKDELTAGSTIDISPAAELLDFLREGLGAEAIDQDDFDLMLAVLDAADEIRPQPGRGGLTGEKVARRVAADMPVSPRTVRRRTTRSIAALTEYVQDVDRSA